MSAERPSPRAAGIRYVVVLFVGLLVGALLASMLMATLQRRHALPRAVMQIMQHALDEARRATTPGRCAGVPATGKAHAHLQLLAADLEPVLLPTGTQDRVLSQYSADFTEAVTAWNPQASCSEQTPQVTAVARACDACHRDYR